MNCVKRLLCAALIAATMLPCGAYAVTEMPGKSENLPEGIQEANIPWKSGETLSTEMQNAKAEWKIAKSQNCKNSILLYYPTQAQEYADGMLYCRQDKKGGPFHIIEAMPFLYDPSITEDVDDSEPLNEGWTDKKVKNGKQYRYRLFFVKEDGTYSASNIIKITRLSTPKITRVDTKNKKKVKVSWKKNSKADGYQIKISRYKSMMDSRTYTVSSAKKTSLTLSQLKPNKKYYVQVRSFVKENHKKTYSAKSDLATVKT